jgi:hypothetical protein
MRRSAGDRPHGSPGWRSACHSRLERGDYRTRCDLGKTLADLAMGVALGGDWLDHAAVLRTRPALKSIRTARARIPGRHEPRKPAFGLARLHSNACSGT